MKFSVIIPTRHRPQTLTVCLESLAPGRQGLSASEYEVLVSDDGKEYTVETLVRTRFPWCRWTAGPRRGPAANRNHAAGLARGSWLVFTDDDCIPTGDWLAAFNDRADRATVRILEGKTVSGTDSANPYLFAPVNLEGQRLWSCNFAIRRDAFAELGGFDARFPAAHLEDVDFRRRAVARGTAMEFVPDAIVVHPPRRIGSVWRQARDHQSYFYFARKHQISLAEAGLSIGSFLRSRVRCLRTSNSATVAMRYAGRCAVEAALLVPLCLWWGLRRRRVSP